MLSAFIRNRLCRSIGEDKQEQSYQAEALQDPGGKEINICIVGQYNQLGRPQSYVCHDRLNDSIPQSLASTIEGNQVQATRRDLTQRGRVFIAHPLFRNIPNPTQVQEPRRPFPYPFRTSFTYPACDSPQRVRNSNMTLSFVAYFTTTVQPYIHLPLPPRLIAQRFIEAIQH